MASTTVSFVMETQVDSIDYSSGDDSSTVDSVMSPGEDSQSLNVTEHHQVFLPNLQDQHEREGAGFSDSRLADLNQRTTKDESNDEQQPYDEQQTYDEQQPYDEQDLGDIRSNEGSLSESQTGQTSWSYREQFKQLYTLSDEPDRKAFLDKLFIFMQQKGTPISRIPIMAKQPLDLFKLFKLVVERGGLLEVIRRKAWREIAKALDLPASITSAAFTLRTQYLKYLYPYECVIEKLSQPQEIRDAIEGNKRDRRISTDIEEYTTSPPTTARLDHHPILIRTTENPAVSTRQVTPPHLPAVHLVQSPIGSLPPVSLPTGSPYSSGIILTSPNGSIIHTPHIAVGPHGAPVPLVVAPGPIVRPSFSSPVPSQTILTADKSEEREYVKTPVKRHSSPISNDPISPPEKRPTTGPSKHEQQGNMPFASIRIRPGTQSNTAAGGLNISNITQNSIVVSIDLNGTIFQGVLFANPSNIELSSGNGSSQK